MENIERTLQNTLVLENVFSQLEFEDKKTFQNVCKVWREVVQDNWRRNAVIALAGPDNPTQPVKSFADFVTIFTTPVTKRKGRRKGTYRVMEKPFHSYRIFFEKIIMSSALPVPKQLPEKWFWKVSALSMENLQLLGCTFRSDQLQTIRWLLLKTCPNLKQLVITAPTFNYETEVNFLPTDEFRELVKANEYYGATVATKLEVFTMLSVYFLGMVRMIDADLALKILKLMPNVKVLTLDRTTSPIAWALQFPVNENGDYIKLEKLTLDMTMLVDIGQTEIFHALTTSLERNGEPQSTLENLTVTFSIHAARSAPYHFHQFFSICGKSMIYLKLEIKVENFVNSPIPGPYWFNDLNGRMFPNLTLLSLKFCEGNLPNQNRMNFDFRALAGMPSLKILYCWSTSMAPISGEVDSLYYNDEDQPISPWNQSIFQSRNPTINLEHLYSINFLLKRRLSEDCLRQLGLIAKNVTHLNLILDDAAFPVVLETWPKLEELELFTGSTVSDELITEAKLARGKLTIKE